MGVVGARGANDVGGAKPPRCGLRWVVWAGPELLGTIAPKGCVFVGVESVVVASATVEDRCRTIDNQKPYPM